MAYLGRCLDSLAVTIDLPTDAGPEEVLKMFSSLKGLTVRVEDRVALNSFCIASSASQARVRSFRVAGCIR
eukprot:10065970-Lingulodinium_polyedra.AAC.1